MILKTIKIQCDFCKKYDIVPAVENPEIGEFMSKFKRLGYSILEHRGNKLCICLMCKKCFCFPSSEIIS